MGIISAVIATVSDVSAPPFPNPLHITMSGVNMADLREQTSTSVPIYICAALYVVMAAVAAIFPFEPYGKRSS